MIEFKHTPGPWRYVDSGYGYGEIEPAVVSHGVEGALIDKEDGLLIATAPDLLAAVIQYRDDLIYRPTAFIIEHRLDMLDKLIARAGGEKA